MICGGERITVNGERSVAVNGQRKSLLMTILGWGVGLLILVGPAPVVAAVSVKAVVERTEVFMGESFILQIQVEGHDAPRDPDLSQLGDFDVQSLGGQQNSSSSITIINGQATNDIRRGFIFNYRLTPKRVGAAAIPALEVVAGNQTFRTQPVPIRVVAPTDVEDFKLRLELSATTCYVGQPLLMTVTWYIGKDVEGFQFGLPVLTDERFTFADVETPIDPNEKQLYLRIPLGDREVIGKRGRGSLDGREFMTVRFQKVLIPNRAGKIEFPQGTVACNVVAGYKRRSWNPNSIFDDDFFFGRQNHAVLRKVVVPSNKPVLTVLDLPREGRPANFTGLVGDYRLEAEAAPTEVRVGDPITLTVRVAGPAYLDNVELPPLQAQPQLAADFKIPAERAAGKVEGRTKVFTQTLRAKHAEVKLIPPIELPYFDARSGEYAVARTKEIPLSVSSTRVLTAQDAEGQALTRDAKTELETWAEGIAHNYEDLSVLKDQAHGPAVWIRSPFWIGMIGLPPLAYLILLAIVSATRARRADPATLRSRRAYGELAKGLNRARREKTGDRIETYGTVLDALRCYLGNKLRLSPGALTFNDVRGRLLERGIAADKVACLERLLEECETSRYAGPAADTQGAADVIERALGLAKDMERDLR